MSKYHKGDKFIVEIKEVMESDNGTLYRSNFKTLTFDDYGLDTLQKYEQPTISEDTLEMERIKALNDGRNEAWELARKITDIVSTSERAKIFGYVVNGITIVDILRDFTPQEALAKLEAYEKEQEQIKVGDIVRIINSEVEYVVTKIEIHHCVEYYCGIRKNGEWLIQKKVEKTGKRIDIQSVLSQITK